MLEIRSLHDEDVRAASVERIGRLSPEAAPRWGEMSVAQMLAHCAEVQQVMNGGPLTGTPWLIRLAAPLIKRSVLSRKPYPKGLRTHPQYRVTSDREFEAEKRRLLDAIEEFRTAAASGDVRHDLFGPLTTDEAGWISYKHLDHHLTQFGV